MSKLPVEQEERKMNDENEAFTSMNSKPSAIESNDPSTIPNNSAARGGGQGHRQPSLQSQVNTNANAVIRIGHDDHQSSLNVLADVSAAKLNSNSCEKLVVRRTQTSISPIVAGQKLPSSQNLNLSVSDSRPGASTSQLIAGRHHHRHQNHRSLKDGPKYYIGTTVLKYFVEAGWLYGKITYFDMDRRYYYITYSNGQNEYYFSDEGNEIDSIVHHAASAMSSNNHLPGYNPTWSQNFSSHPASTMSNGTPLDFSVSHNQQHGASAGRKNRGRQEKSLAARTFGGNFHKISPLRRTSNLRQEIVPQGRRELDRQETEVVAIDLSDDKLSSTKSVKTAGTNIEPKYVEGTKVRNFFPGNGWHNGWICEVDTQNQSYRVRYNYTDGISYEHPFEGTIMDKMVQDSKDFEEQSIETFFFEDDDTADDETSVPKKRKLSIRIRLPQDRESGKSMTHPVAEKSHDEKNKATTKQDCSKIPAPSNEGLKTKKLETVGGEFNKRGPLLTTDQRLKLQGIDLNLKDFKEFLLNKQGISKKTADSYVSSAGKLVRGYPIKSKNWPSGVVFQAPPVRDMSSNFYQIRRDFMGHVSKYGEARKSGNAAVKSSFSNLEKFQVYVYSEITQQPVIKPRKSNLLRKILTDEQRSNLAGIEFDLNAFEEYVVRKQGLTGSYKKKICCAAGRLVRGEVIHSARWPDGVAFHPHPIFSLSADISLMNREAKLHEDKYSEGRNKDTTWCEAYSKLLSFQTYFYEESVENKSS